LQNISVLWAVGGSVAVATRKKYLVKMTTSAWLLQFQGSLNRWVVWFKNTNIIHHPLTIQLSFKELAQTLVSKPTQN